MTAADHATVINALNEATRKAKGWQKRAEAAEAERDQMRAALARMDTAYQEVELIGHQMTTRAEAAETERDQARDALRDMEKTLRDTEEQLGVWVSYVEANTDEQTSYTREVLAAARAALGDKPA